MLRFGAIFVVGCMVLVAALAGIALRFGIGLSGAESTLIALALLTALMLYNAVTTRLRDRTDLSTQIADLSRGTADLAQQVAELGRKTAALESQGDTISEAANVRAAKAIEPLARELSELGALVEQLAETVANHQIPRAAALADRPGPRDGEAIAPGGDHLAEIVRSAVERNELDLYLQPVVSLPQRKVRYYEALTRVNAGDGRILQLAELAAAANSAGLMPRVDNHSILRCVQVVRRLQVKNREIGLFCNVSMTTLNDPQAFPRLARFMDANRAIAPSLMLQLSQADWRSIGAIELESLASLREMGFRFCMDHVTDLHLDPRDLAGRGIRFVKIPASVLLGRSASRDMPAAELSDLMARSGISLIADGIETENQVVDLLDYDVRYAQGLLFSPPRPVRAEAMRGAAESASVLTEPHDNPRDPPPAAQSSPASSH